ncbi:MAG: hypothetical protein K0S07_210 [Chlamydiales bacterium]|nr:hypothetical protein [Chlamydiales bacterium]
MDPKRKETWARLYNAAVFYGVWFIALIEAAKGHGWLASLTLPMIAIHLIFLSDDWYGELKLVLLAMGVGAGLDSLWSYGFDVRYQPAGSSPLAPLWIAALWGYLAITCNSSLKWLQSRPFLVAFFSFISAPFCYLSAERMGAVQLPEERVQLLLLIAISWSLLIPGLMICSRRKAGKSAHL